MRPTSVWACGSPPSAAARASLSAVRYRPWSNASYAASSPASAALAYEPALPGDAGGGVAGAGCWPCAEGAVDARGTAGRAEGAIAGSSAGEAGSVRMTLAGAGGAVLDRVVVLGAGSAGPSVRPSQELVSAAAAAGNSIYMPTIAATWMAKHRWRMMRRPLPCQPAAAGARSAAAIAATSEWVSA